MSDTADIVARLSGMSADHGPDGWPAVRMRDITALCNEVTRLRAELAEAQKLARDDFDLRAEQRDERDELRAALAQAGAGKEPRELDRHGWVRPRADGAKARCGGPAMCKHCQGEQLLIAAHPPPAQREPLSDDPWRKLYRRAINEANGLANYVEDRPELRSAERRISAIEAEARTLADSGPNGAAS